jgi:hypothetical protein
MAGYSLENFCLNAFLSIADIKQIQCRFSLDERINPSFNALPQDFIQSILHIGRG